MKFRTFDLNPLMLSRAFGYLSEYETVALQALSASMPSDSKIVNFGAGTGTSSLAIVTGNPHAQVWTIDISEGGPLGGLENERNAFAERNSLLNQPPLKLPIQILGCSWEVGEQWETPLDMVFIDGDHSLKAVEKDINSWARHIKPGGYIVFHDYGRDVWPEVKMAVDRRMTAYTKIFLIDTMIVFLK